MPSERKQRLSHGLGYLLLAGFALYAYFGGYWSDTPLLLVVGIGVAMMGLGTLGLLLREVLAAGESG